jgi:hypothetical protein
MGVEDLPGLVLFELTEEDMDGKAVGQGEQCACLEAQLEHSSVQVSFGDRSPF